MAKNYSRIVDDTEEYMKDKVLVDGYRINTLVREFCVTNKINQGTTLKANNLNENIFHAAYRRYHSCVDKFPDMFMYYDLEGRKITDPVIFYKNDFKLIANLFHFKKERYILKPVIIDKKPEQPKLVFEDTKKGQINLFDYMEQMEKKINSVKEETSEPESNFLDKINELKVELNELSKKIDALEMEYILS